MYVRWLLPLALVAVWLAAWSATGPGPAGQARTCTDGSALVGLVNRHVLATAGRPGHGLFRLRAGCASVEAGD